MRMWLAVDTRHMYFMQTWGFRTFNATGLIIGINVVFIFLWTCLRWDNVSAHNVLSVISFNCLCVWTDLSKRNKHFVVLLTISEDDWPLFHVQESNQWAGKDRQNRSVSEMAIHVRRVFRRSSQLLLRATYVFIVVLITVLLYLRCLLGLGGIKHYVCPRAYVRQCVCESASSSVLFHISEWMRVQWFSVRSKTDLEPA